jgi:hypothetical protein
MSNYRDSIGKVQYDKIEHSRYFQFKLLNRSNFASYLTEINKIIESNVVIRPLSSLAKTNITRPHFKTEYSGFRQGLKGFRKKMGQTIINQYIFKN